MSQEKKVDNARKRVSAILTGALSGREERFRYEQGGQSYIRWGLVEEEFTALVDGLSESVEAAEEEYREIEAELDRAGVQRAHILAAGKVPIARITEESSSDIVNRVRALARERDGWKDIAESNRLAYESVLKGDTQ